MYIQIHLFTYALRIDTTEESSEVKLQTKWTNIEEVGRVREKEKKRKKVREEKESEERRSKCAKR